MDGTDRRARLARSRLYLVLEARPHGRDPSELLDAALRGGVDVVQLRDKDLPAEDLVRAAEPFRRLCDAHGALFVLNDRPELVERCDADGVHVGQDDAPISEARHMVGAERLVGLSASTRAELEAVAGVDYAGVGAVFGTPTKPDADAGGLELVRAARDLLAVPWFAIGGIELDTVDAVAVAGAYGVAVVRALRDADDPERAARLLRAPLPPSGAIVSGPGESRRARLPQLDLLESSLGADGTGARPHTHDVHTDLFYVLEGELAFRLGEETVRVPAGSCVAAPPGFLHGFRNSGTTPARYLNIHAPGVFARGRDGGEQPEQYDMFFGADRATAGARGTVSGPGDGERLAKEHRMLLVRSSQPHVDVLESFVSPEFDGADPHVHLRHADCFYVLEGELEVMADGETARAGGGMCVVVPPGVVHAFTSAGRARFLNIHAPSCGFTEYLRRLGAGEEVDTHAYDVYDV